MWGRDATGKRVSLLADDEHEKESHKAFHFGTQPEPAPTQQHWHSRSVPSLPRLVISDHNEQKELLDSSFRQTLSAYPSAKHFETASVSSSLSAEAKSASAMYANAQKSIEEFRAKESAKRFVCTECGKKFTTRGHLTRHSSIHKPDRDFFHCPYEGCKSRFSRKDNLTSHLKNHQRRNSPTSMASNPSVSPYSIPSSSPSSKSSDGSTAASLALP